MGPEMTNPPQPSQPDSKGLMFWLVEPSQDIREAENRQIASLISAVLLVFFVLACAGLVFASAQRVLDGKVEIKLLAVITLLLLFAYGLSRTRYNSIAGTLAFIILSLVPFGEILALRYYENILASLIWLVLPIILSAVLLSLGNLALLVLIDGVGLGVLAIVGPETGNHQLLLAAGLILSTSVTMAVLVINQQRLGREQRSMLLKNIHALENKRMDLEAQSVENAWSAAAFKAEAEDAHRALESQTWQLSGINELGKVMRGLQTIPSLASSIMKQVCRYSDIPVGAFFLTEGDTLCLVACYAYPFPTSPPPRFKLGSGLVGEAAREKQVITMRDIPDNYLPITSGLGEATPAQIIAVPCIYQEQVIGVMELAALEPFSTTQIQFITASMEFIANALHAAQIRAIIDALLIDARHRSEELMVQKKELQEVTAELDRRELDMQRWEQRVREQQNKLNTMYAEQKDKDQDVQGKIGVPDDDKNS